MRGSQPQQAGQASRIEIRSGPGASDYQMSPRLPVQFCKELGATPKQAVEER